MEAIRYPHVDPELHCTQPTHWEVLECIFNEVKIAPSDVLVDIGCGDGRVIDFWLGLGIDNEIIGIELDAKTAIYTAGRFRDWPNVVIIRGDATRVKIPGTLFYLFNPFHGSAMERFMSMLPEACTVVYNNYKELHRFADWKVTAHAFPWRYAIARRPL